MTRFAAAVLGFLVMALAGCADVWGYADLRLGDAGAEAEDDSRSDVELSDDAAASDATGGVPNDGAPEADSTTSDAATEASDGADGATAVTARNCSDLHSAGNATDGDYLIDIDGPGPDPAFTIYCYHMATIEPLEYLDLRANVDAGLATSNVSNYIQPTEGDWFVKVRLNVPGLTVDRSDRTFAFAPGDAGPPGLPYALAGSGVGLGDTSAHANIDLTGTPFRVAASNKFVAEGYGPACVATVSPDRKVVNLQGGGYAGSCDIASDAGNSFSTAGAGTNPLALEFAP